MFSTQIGAACFMWNPINGIDKNSVSHLKMGRGEKRIVSVQ